MGCYEGPAGSDLKELFQQFLQEEGWPGNLNPEGSDSDWNDYFHWLKAKSEKYEANSYSRSGIFGAWLCKNQGWTKQDFPSIDIFD